MGFIGTFVGIGTAVAAIKGLADWFEESPTGCDRRGEGDYQLPGAVDGARGNEKTSWAAPVQSWAGNCSSNDRRPRTPATCWRCRRRLKELPRQPSGRISPGKHTTRGSLWPQTSGDGGPGAAAVPTGTSTKRSRSRPRQARNDRRPDGRGRSGGNSENFPAR